MYFIFLLTIISFVNASEWDTYPQVPQTASINGFADPIYSDLPKCARECVKVSTGNTPCPYWDTGCLCVMPQWSGLVAQCVAEECEGSDVDTATSLAYSLCSSAGANVWMMPASITSALTLAAGNNAVETVDASQTDWDYLTESTERSSLSSNGIASYQSNSTSAKSESTSSSGNNYSESGTSSAMGHQLTTGIFTLIAVVLSNLC